MRLPSHSRYSFLRLALFEILSLSENSAHSTGHLSLTIPHHSHPFCSSAYITHLLHLSTLHTLRHILSHKPHLSRHPLGVYTSCDLNPHIPWTLRTWIPHVKNHLPWPQVLLRIWIPSVLNHLPRPQVRHRRYFVTFHLASLPSFPSIGFWRDQSFHASCSSTNISFAFILLDLSYLKDPANLIWH